VAALAALAGCSGLLGDDGDAGDSDDSNGDDASDGDGETAADLDAVPVDTAFLAAIDVQQLLEDDQLEERLQQLGEMDGTVGATPTVDELATRLESEWGLDPRGLSTALVFVTASGEQSGATVLRTDWSETEIRDALAADGPVESTSHRGQTVYESRGDGLGVLPDGRYVVGTLEGVRASIDAATGNAASVDGPARTAYERVPEGYLRIAFSPPEDGAAPIRDEMGTANAPRYGAGTLYRRGDTRGGELLLEFDSADSAGETASAIEGGLTQFREELGAPNSGMPPELSAELDRLLEETTVSQDGTTVSVEATDGDGWLPVVLSAVAGSFVLGLGGGSGPGPGGQPIPQVSFESEWDAEEATVTITHVAGDTVRADRLSIRDPEPIGTWEQLGGSAYSTLDGEPAVGAGDTVTVDASPGTSYRIVWEGPDGTAAELFSFQIPDE
jgi:hypothetical protein